MDEVFPPFVLVKPFVHGQPRTSVPTVFVVYSTVDREILIVLFVYEMFFVLGSPHPSRQAVPPSPRGRQGWSASNPLPLKLSFNFN